MTVLAPAVTIILTSHMKGALLGEAITSVRSQTRQDYQLLVVDSGVWLWDEVYQQQREICDQMQYMWRLYHNVSPLLQWVTTGERPDLATYKCPVGWTTNEVFASGLVRGRYVCHFYDDDLYDPRFVELMAGALDTNPHAGAAWCSEDQVRLRPDGTTSFYRRIVADQTKTGATFDQQVDGAQVMYRRSLLDALGDRPLTEDPTDSVCRHSDGLFWDRLLSAHITVPVPEVLITHRFTDRSTYTTPDRI